MSLSFVIAFGGPLLFGLVSMLIVLHLDRLNRRDREKGDEKE